MGKNKATAAAAASTSAKKASSSKSPSKDRGYVAPLFVLVVAMGAALFLSRSDSGNEQQPVVNTIPRQMMSQSAEERVSEDTPATDGALPAGWGSAEDPSSGKTYYYKLSSRKSQWERPTEAATDDPPDADDNPNCALWANSGECENNPRYMQQECKVACAAMEAGRQTSGEVGSGLRDTWNKPAECVAWAGSGECKSNPAFMNANCAYSCSPEVLQATKDRLEAARAEYRQRCPRAPDMGPALEAGGMNATFERIMSDFAELQPEMVSADPPIVLFHNFLSAAEAEKFISHGQGKYTESRGVGYDKDGKVRSRDATRIQLDAARPVRMVPHSHPCALASPVPTISHRADDTNHLSPSLTISHHLSPSLTNHLSPRR